MFVIQFLVLGLSLINQNTYILSVWFYIQNKDITSAVMQLICCTSFHMHKYFQKKNIAQNKIILLIFTYVTIITACVSVHDNAQAIPVFATLFYLYVTFSRQKNKEIKACHVFISILWMVYSIQSGFFMIGISQGIAAIWKAYEYAKCSQKTNFFLQN